MANKLIPQVCKCGLSAETIYGRDGEIILDYVPEGETHSVRARVTLSELQTDFWWYTGDQHAGTPAGYRGYWPEVRCKNCQ